jgi:hypothetical protein
MKQFTLNVTERQHGRHLDRRRPVDIRGGPRDSVNGVFLDDER